jgi:PAS domain S-box-containing protein
MNNVASDILMLINNLSQINKEDKIVELFFQGIESIFPDYTFKWITENEKIPESSLPVCTRTKTYGHIQFEKTLCSSVEQYALFQNATQLLAILLERLEQEELLNNQKTLLQHLIDEKTNHLVEKQNELNEKNGEFTTMNEELIETNKWLLALNEQLQSEITERKKAKEELCQSEEKFKNVFDHASVGKSITSIDGSLKVNNAFCDIVGYTNEELSSMKWQDITHPDDIEFNQQILQSILTGEKKSADWQKRYIHKNGNIVWATISTSLQRDGKGNPLFYITTVNDITVQKLMQEELLYSEQLFSNVFYNSPVAITITSRGDGKIVEANKTFLNNMEFTRDEVVGKSIMELGVFYDQGIREKLIGGLLKNGFVSDFECTFRSKTGKISVGLMSMSFIQYKGKPHQLTTVIDITERKKAENELEYSHNRLEEAQEIAKIGNWEANLVTGELYWSEEIFNIFGFNPESFKPNVNAFYEAVHPEDRDKVLESEKLSEQTGLHNVVHRIIRSTGEIRFVHELARRYSNESGDLIMLQGTVQDVTERMQAEDELKNKEILLNLTGKMAKVGGWEFDVQTMKQTWTEEVYRIHEVGLDFDQNVEKGINFYAPGSIEIIGKAVQGAIEFGEPYDLELELITYKGNHRWVHSIGNAYQENGKTKKVFGSFQDITESKQAEIKLRDSERLLNESQRISGIGSYVMDIKSGIWSGSVFLNEMFGINEWDDHSVEGWLAVIHPDDRTMMANYFANEVLGNKGRFDKEYRIVAKNTGQERWVHGIGELEFDHDSNPIRMIGTIRDNTEIKKADEELRKLQRALEQSPDSIIITNCDGDIEYANPAILKLTGYSNEELIGKNQRLFSSGKMKRREYIELWKTINAGNVWQGEFQNRKKNGELIWQSATISPIFDDKGVITHYLSISEDITEKKKLTMELIKAKEQAEESDRLKSSFLANMSHEIRTPMNSIMGFASLLPEEDSRELMSQYAHIIVRNSEQLVHIIDDIVLYSRLQTRLLSLFPSKFSAQTLFNDIKQSFNLPEFRQGVELVIRPGTNENIEINTDYEKIRQVITNLVSNAFKYTSTGCISISIEKQNNHLLFAVNDTGMGIPATELNKVFDRFYRATNVDKGAISGTGLGLSIVKELLELLGGQIWAESEVGAGSTFYFTLAETSNL